MSYSLIIPAQEKNRYHEEGDFSPFGGTSLIEWKVSQCIETINKSDIYIASSSQKPIAICKKYGINFIKRQEAQSLETDLIDIAKQITTEYVLWVNRTSPFIGGEEYKSALNVFFNSDKHDSLISTVEKREYMFFENKKIILKIIQMVEKYCSQFILPPMAFIFLPGKIFWKARA